MMLKVSWENPSDTKLTGPVEQKVEIISVDGTKQEHSFQWDGNKYNVVKFSDVDETQSYLISVKHVSQLGFGEAESHHVQEAAGIEEE